MREYRFYFHYNKQARKPTIHFRGKCYSVDNIHCFVDCKSKKNKRQPYFVMQGMAEVVVVELFEGEKYATIWNPSKDENE